jgi:PAS domain S-box-containing protein
MSALSVLVVEDEAIIAEDIRRRLSKLGYSVAGVVCTGNDAVALNQFSKPDLVLMDIQLQGNMNGIEAARQIRQESDTPIVYLTSHTDPKTVDAATLTEPFGYLLKPIDDRELRITLQMAIFQHYTQKQLGRTERWMATTLSSLGDGLISTDAAGRIFYMNPRAEQLTGWHVSEAIGEELETIFATRDARSGEQIRDTVHLAMRAGDTLYPDRRIVLSRRDGRDLFIDQNASPIRDGDGNIMGAVIVFRDSTESVRAQDALNDSESRLRQACRARDEFFAKISHELRTPLTPVMLMLSNMIRDPDLSSTRREELQDCLTHIEQEAHLLDDLLDITRIMTGNLGLKREEVDFHALMSHVSRAARKQEGVEIGLDLAASHHFIMADKVRLRQVLSSLLDNAFKFTPLGGRIEIRTSDADDSMIRLEVQDNGKGICTELLPRVFDAFEQGDPVTARQFGGLGLGLAITKQIVEAHGGRITASSAGAGQGSVFTVLLPHCVPALVKQDDFGARPQSSCLTPSRILLVEDHEPSLNVLACLLRNLGHTVHTAATKTEALLIAQSESFDLVISDLALPDGDGCDIMRHVQEIRSTKGIALTGFGQEEDLLRTRDAGFARHLVKPVSVEQLVSAVETVRSTP